MCYRVVAHKSTHDVRVTISHPEDASMKWVNPYATPAPCKCGESAGIAKFLQCPHHDCCRTSTRIIKCAHARGEKKGDCQLTEYYHTYEAVPTGLEAGDYIAAHEMNDTRDWAPLPILDALPATATSFTQDFHDCTVPQPEFRPARWTMAFVYLRHEYLSLLKELGVALEAHDNAKAVLERAYEAYNSDEEEASLCRHSLQEHEWPEGKAVLSAEAEEKEAARIVKEIEGETKFAWSQMKGCDEGMLTGLDAWDGRIKGARWTGGEEKAVIGEKKPRGGAKPVLGLPSWLK